MMIYSKKENIEISAAKSMNAKDYDEIIDSEGKNLFSIINLIAANKDDARDVLEDVYDEVRRLINEKYAV